MSDAGMAGKSHSRNEVVMRLHFRRGQSSGQAGKAVESVLGTKTHILSRE